MVLLKRNPHLAIEPTAPPIRSISSLPARTQTAYAQRIMAARTFDKEEYVIKLIVSNNRHALQELAFWGGVRLYSLLSSKYSASNQKYLVAANAYSLNLTQVLSLMVVSGGRNSHLALEPTPPPIKNISSLPTRTETAYSQLIMAARTFDKEEYLNSIVRNVVKILPPDSFQTLTAREELAAGDQAYWSSENDHFAHRKAVWLWIQGTVPHGLDVESSPMVVDWSSEQLKSKDATNWPPMNATLSDLVVYKIIAAEISQRDRYKYWPKVFQSSGHIVMERSNAGPAANQRKNGKEVYDLIYRSSYVLHGDLGAMRKTGSKDPQKTGAKTNVMEDKGQFYLWSMTESDSCYPATTQDDRFLPSLMEIAVDRSYLIGFAEETNITLADAIANMKSGEVAPLRKATPASQRVFTPNRQLRSSANSSEAFRTPSTNTLNAKDRLLRLKGKSKHSSTSPTSTAQDKTINDLKALLAQEKAKADSAVNALGHFAARACELNDIMSARLISMQTAGQGMLDAAEMDGDDVDNEALANLFRDHIGEATDTHRSAYEDVTMKINELKNSVITRLASSGQEEISRRVIDVFDSKYRQIPREFFETLPMQGSWQDPINRQLQTMTPKSGRKHSMARQSQGTPTKRSKLRHPADTMSGARSPSDAEMPPPEFNETALLERPSPKFRQPMLPAEKPYAPTSNLDRDGHAIYPARKSQEQAVVVDEDTEDLTGVVSSSEDDDASGGNYKGSGKRVKTSLRRTPPVKIKKQISRPDAQKALGSDVDREKQKGKVALETPVPTEDDDTTEEIIREVDVVGVRRAGRRRAQDPIHEAEVVVTELKATMFDDAFDDEMASAVFGSSHLETVRGFSRN